MQTEIFDNKSALNSILLPDPMTLDSLRNQIREIERSGKLSPPLSAENELTVSLGSSEINEALPWGGLPIMGLHEIFGDTAAVGFTTALMNKFAKNSDAPILWCQHGRNLYGHGLVDFGIDPDRLILVEGKSDNDILWAMEEGLRCADIAVVIGKPYKVPPIIGRRLQLAAEKNSSTGLLLRPQDRSKNPQSVSPTNAALTRWHVTAAPSITPARGPGLSIAKWNLELQRYRYCAFNLQKQKTVKRVTSWQVEWNHETGDLSVATDLCNRSVQPQQEKQKTS